MELATHEILYAVGTDLRVDPCVDGLTPDFSTRFKKEGIFVECTVVQESDEQFKREQNENALKQIADTIDSGPFRLDWQLHRAGCNMPNTHSFQRKIKEWVASLNPAEVFKRIEERDFDYGSFFWRQDGWIVQLRPMRGPPAHLRRPGIGAIAGQGKSGFVDDDIQLRKGLEGKADRYKTLEAPFLVVTGSSKWPTDLTAVLHALFGSRALRYSGCEIEFEETWPFSSSDNLLGSPEKPRNCHVSAVLHKSFANSFGHHASMWGLCHRDTQWMLIHNTWATRPLPRGMFPFAFEWTLEKSKFVEVQPSCTLNQLLGLPDPWPGKER